MLQQAIEFARTESPYMHDFRDVWEATRYLDSGDAPSTKQAKLAAEALAGALRSWGAGTRRSARLASLDTMTTALLDKDLIALLGTVRNQQRQTLGDRHSRATLAMWVEALELLAAQLFEPELDSMVYPAKALMLLTGVGPAPDSRVRTALAHLGLSGWAGKTPLLPSAGGDQEALVRLWWWTQEQVQRDWEASASVLVGHKALQGLVDERAYGRLADMALFVVGKRLADGPWNDPGRTAGAPRRGPVETQRQPPAQTTGVLNMATWAGRSTFQYRHVDGGFRVIYGGGPTFVLPRRVMDQIQSEFGGQTIKLGTSRNAPPVGSLGAWLQANLTPTATASYVAPLLVAEGRAQRVPWSSSSIEILSLEK